MAEGDVNLEQDSIPTLAHRVPRYHLAASNILQNILLLYLNTCKVYNIDKYELSVGCSPV